MCVIIYNYSSRHHRFVVVDVGSTPCHITTVVVLFLLFFFCFLASYYTAVYKYNTIGRGIYYAIHVSVLCY